MLAQGLRQLQTLLGRKADAVQREFTAAGDELQALSRRIKDARGEDTTALLAAQEALREKQHALAGEVNVWRERARAVLRQPAGEGLNAYLTELDALGDADLHAGVAHIRYVLTASDEQLTELARQQATTQSSTQAGRLLERARTEYDLRGTDPEPRRKAAFEFANRTGVAQNDALLAELEAAAEHPDPQVKALATLTVIQMYRFRAKQLSDLDAVHAAVRRLAELKHPSVVAVLAEVAQTPRTGYSTDAAGAVISGNNLRTRLVALEALALWHTPEAQSALRTCVRDREPQIAAEASRLLEAAPGPGQ